MDSESVRVRNDAVTLVNDFVKTIVERTPPASIKSDAGEVEAVYAYGLFAAILKISPDEKVSVSFISRTINDDVVATIDSNGAVRLDAPGNRFEVDRTAQTEIYDQIMSYFQDFLEKEV